MLVNWQHVGSSQAGWVPGRIQRGLRDTYDRQFKFTSVTGVSKFGTYSTTAVLKKFYPKSAIDVLAKKPQVRSAQISAKIAHISARNGWVTAGHNELYGPYGY